MLSTRRREIDQRFDANSSSPFVAGGEETLEKGISNTLYPQADRKVTVPLEPKYYPVVKRAIDITVAATLLLILFPVFAIITILILFQGGGPVLFTQMRIGQRGRLFRFYKFRSMVPNAEALKSELAARNEATGPIFKMRDDPRVTPIGRILRRYSLDELPQLVNVLIGDMSLVGPRPHLPQEIEKCPNYPMERLSVRPGLVCLREVQGRSNLSFDRWLESDLHYIQTRSLATDMTILLSVFRAVVQAEGAY